jgi:transposase
MYIRKTKTRVAKGVPYYSYRMVESGRDEQGKVKQRTLLNLGAQYKAIPESDHILLSERAENIISGQQNLLLLNEKLETEAQRIAHLIIKKHSQPIAPTSKRSEGKYDLVDLSTLENSDVRTIGVEHLSYETAKRLNLPQILEECGLSEKETKDALATIIGRLIFPGSELYTANCLRHKSALDEVLGTDFSSVHKNRLYKISDILLKNKEAIESKLYKREKELFAFKEIVTLYYLTNTYFEGSSLSNDNGALGHSKEKRSDCKLVTLALVLDGSGFPKKSKIFKGNVSEGSTLEEMLKEVSSKEAIVVMDAGIATADNIKWLTDNKYKYLVISRKRNQTLPDIAGVIVKDDPNNKVTSFLVKTDEESELYCHSEGMERRSNIMLQKYIDKFETELKKISNGLTKKGTVKKYDSIHQKIGRLKEKYSKVRCQFKIDITSDKKKELVTQLTWTIHPEKQSKAPGIYCIRTNQTQLNNQEIWNTYRMLNDIEDAFRALKTDLGLRPVYHQKTDRISGHIFISVLAYHMLHSIRYQLMKHSINDCWQTIMFKLSTHFRITNSVQRKNDKPIHIRKSMRANPEQLSIYKACGVDASILNSTLTTY